jgi:tRNA (cytidine/uridine-2'-O-)-methyltransferase
MRVKRQDPPQLASAASSRAQCEAVHPPAQDRTRLRAATVDLPFHVVLVEPEIPPNTGNIARLCAATQTPLHLVGQLGFSIDEHAVRRAGIDYWHLVQIHQHPDLSAAEAAIRATTPARTWLLSGKAERSVHDAKFEAGDCFVFGKESVGLPDALLEARRSETVGIPTIGEVRSLNLANSVAIVLYEALRQTGALANPARR